MVCKNSNLFYKPGSAKFLRGSSPITQPLWAMKKQALSGWCIIVSSSSTVSSLNGYVKYLWNRQAIKREKTKRQAPNTYGNLSCNSLSLKLKYLIWTDLYIIQIKKRATCINDGEFFYFEGSFEEARTDGASW